MDTVFVLENADGEVAVWGDGEKATGPIAFATPADAEQFRAAMPTGELLAITDITMAELLTDAPRHGWTELWTVGTANGTGSQEWFSHPMSQ